MFKINEDKSIYLTRGDIACFDLTLEQADNTLYTFKVGDVVRVKVFKKKGCEEVLLQKDFVVEKSKTEVEIFLGKEDTKIGEIINKPTNYWYEVELNPDTNPQTIIGYDEDGEKIFRLFPEGGVLNEL